MDAITANRAFYIKLGQNGSWEDHCLKQGVLWFGYEQTPDFLCSEKRWEKVHAFWKEVRGSSGTATRDVNQIRAFHEATETDIFITFSRGSMHWCRPTGPVRILENRISERSTRDGWHSTSIKGTKLLREHLSGELVKVEMFRGTICSVRPFEYLMRRLNDELSPVLQKADVAEAQILESTVSLLHLLTWRDFELLVELVFAASGWRRISSTGGTQKSADIELLLPTTGERAFVQIKSAASRESYENSQRDFRMSAVHDRLFFAWHTGNLDATDPENGVVPLGPERLAKMVLDAGLWTWLRQKVA